MGKNKQFLIENNLMGVYENFMRLCNETTYFSGNLEEDGEDDMNGEQPQGDQGMGQDMGAGAPPMDDGMGGDPNASGAPSMDANMGGNQDMGQGSGEDAAFDPSQQPPIDGGMGADQGQDMGMPPMDDEMSTEEDETEEDEVIDVDDITNAQEKTNARVNKVGRNLGKVDDKLVDVMNLIKSLKSMIDSNNAEIEAFKTEFEKRNPTPTEKLNLRSLDSYPFNTNPTKYWQDKAEQPTVSGNRYEAYADNSVPTAKQEKEYIITQDDVDDYTDTSIQDSFHIDDDLRSTIEKIFDL